MEIKKIGVIGCGIMGGGIAQVCAQAGYEVIVSEIKDEFLKKGLATINGALSKAVEKGRMQAADKDATMGRIRGTLTYNDFKDCDLIIEAAVENMDLKKKIFAELDGIAPAHAILASNTSCLSIIDMAMATKRPSLVLGLHFFNPVPLMKLVEIVKTVATSEAAIETMKDFGKKVGKTTVVAKDTTGFIVNRLLAPFVLDAIRLYENGIASKEDIDNAVNLGLNHPMGPLTLTDLIGLDTTLFIVDAMYQEFKDQKFNAPSILRDMVTAGYLGRKTGKGFYNYK